MKSRPKYTSPRLLVHTNLALNVGREKPAELKCALLPPEKAGQMLPGSLRSLGKSTRATLPRPRRDFPDMRPPLPTLPSGASTSGFASALLSAAGSTTMINAKNGQNRINSPNWYLARASSTESTGQVELATWKPPVSIPESQLTVKNDLELIRAQLYAQTKAFQALSHSITLLEQESRHQQIRINELEEGVQFAACLSHGEMFDGLIQKKIQELWKAMTKELEGLQGSMMQKQNSMENLSQDVLESKKFLWEELESVQSELRRIHQKLKDQEVDITRNLVSIKKMQENQMKCTKFLSQLRGKIPDDALEAVDNKPGTEELDEIWSSVNTLSNSIINKSIRSDKRNYSRMKSAASVLVTPNEFSSSCCFLLNHSPGRFGAWAIGTPLYGPFPFTRFSLSPASNWDIGMISMDSLFCTADY